MKKDRGNRASVLFAAMHLETVHMADIFVLFSLFLILSQSR